MPGRTGDACAGRLPCDAVLESHRSLRSLWPATAWNSLALRPERLGSTYKPLSTALHDCALVLNLQWGLREPRSGDGPAMTISTQDANRRRLFATSAAAVWIAAGLGYVILEAIAAAGFRNPYSYAHNFISDLGITSRGMFQGRMIDSSLACLMNTAFCLQGALFLVGAVLIVRALEAQWAGLFLTLAAANAVGDIAVATFHSGPAAHADEPYGFIRPARCLRSSEATRQSWLGLRLFGTPMGRRGIAAYRPGSVCRPTELRVACYWIERRGNKHSAARSVGTMQRLFDHRVANVHRRLPTHLPSRVGSSSVNARRLPTCPANGQSCRPSPSAQGGARRPMAGGQANSVMRNDGRSKM